MAETTTTTASAGVILRSGRQVTPLWSQTPVDQAAEGTTEQFRAFHRLLQQGHSPAQAGAALGVDRLLAKLWPALPANHFDEGAPRLGPEAQPSAEAASVPVPSPLPVGLNRPLRIHMPRGLGASDSELRQALQVDVSPAALSNAIAAARRGWYSGATRYVAVPRCVYDSITGCAEQGGVDVGFLAGQLLAAHWGLTTQHERPTVPSPSALPSARPRLPMPSRSTTPYRPRPRPQQQAPETVLARGAALAARRNALVPAVSQRELAKAAGLSRGMLAEIEKGRRGTEASWRKVSEALDRLAETAERVLPRGPTGLHLPRPGALSEPLVAPSAVTLETEQRATASTEAEARQAVADRVRQLRRAWQLSQGELAGLGGLLPRHVLQLEQCCVPLGMARTWLERLEAGLALREARAARPK